MLHLDTTALAVTELVQAGNRAYYVDLETCPIAMLPEPYNNSWMFPPSIHADTTIVSVAWLNSTDLPRMLGAVH